MKKISALLIAAAMCLTLAACTPKQEVEQVKDSIEDIQAALDEFNASLQEYLEEDNEFDGYIDYDYEAEIDEFIEEFDETMSSLVDLADIADEIDENDDELDEDDLNNWCETFVNAKSAVSTWLSWLEMLDESVPDDYRAAHLDVVSAVESVSEVITNFEEAVAAAIDGETDAFYEGLADFVAEIEKADDVWNDAIALYNTGNIEGDNDDEDEGGNDDGENDGDDENED
ncbi:MAG: hypothetical protein FWF94_05400 [Oscillospiraceae bacterium]|nr:hypothetical protein [Oscillospiraceae bacterium]